jgi:hypothetical protein
LQGVLAEFGKLIADEIEKWARLVKLAGWPDPADFRGATIDPTINEILLATGNVSD